ncbi:MAG: class I SAM-dependent methyltransferase, partial [Bacteroidota bacterium]
GFCLPYLSPSDVSKLISDCYNLLTEDGVLYLSFVEGDPDKSGFMAASTGDRTYFYYHDLENIKKQLSDYNFEEVKIFSVAYPKSETINEMHTLLIVRKRK